MFYGIIVCVRTIFLDLALSDEEYVMVLNPNYDELDFAGTATDDTSSMHGPTFQLDANKPLVRDALADIRDLTTNVDGVGAVASQVADTLLAEGSVNTWEFFPGLDGGDAATFNQACARIAAVDGVILFPPENR